MDEFRESLKKDSVRFFQLNFNLFFFSSNLFFKLNYLFTINDFLLNTHSSNLHISKILILTNMHYELRIRL